MSILYYYKLRAWWSGHNPPQYIAKVQVISPVSFRKSTWSWHLKRKKICRRKYQGSEKHQMDGMGAALQRRNTPWQSKLPGLHPREPTWLKQTWEAGEEQSNVKPAPYLFPHLTTEELTLRTVDRGKRNGVEILCLQRCMSDLRCIHYNEITPSHTLGHLKEVAG